MNVKPMDFTSVRMPRELWEKWDAALRSGEYAQTTGILKNDTGYCCLGVLQDVAEGDVERDSDGCPLGFPTWLWFGRHEISARHEPDAAFDPTTVMHIAMETKYEHSASAVHCNDGLRLSFVQIADLLKQCVEFTDGGRP